MPKTAIDEPQLQDAPPANGAEPEDAGDGRRWYVIHTYSGYENKVKKNLESRIESMDVREQIYQVVIPTEEEIEIRDGQRRTVSRKLYPGYVMVEMIELHEGDELSNRAWYVVRNTPGVTGFVGSGNKPVPLDDTEVKSILRTMRQEEPKVKVSFTVGQTVRIVDGPFADFNGQVDSIDTAKGKVRVLVSMFGRDTPMELDLLQVERL
ncbi:MAG: transcription termination/antitermination protein NusG [Dehalococcoidia bacterium]